MPALTIESIKADAVIVLQARLGSSRLPGKALLPLGDSTLFGWCIARLQRTGIKLVSAIPDSLQNDPLVEESAKLGIPVIRGSEQDVLSRFVVALKQHPATWVVRATADNPFVDWQLTLRLLHHIADQNADYIIGTDYPYGTTTEVCRSSVLLSMSDEQELAASDREHVTLYVRNNPQRFNVRTFASPVDHSRILLTVDTPEEYEQARKLVEAGIKISDPTKRILACQKLIQ